jgi:hypothetical protein
VSVSKRPPASEDEFWEIAEPLLDGKGLGADLLEVGYLYRGIGSLEDHLRLWDLALANGIRLVGTGTSDSPKYPRPNSAARPAARLVVHAVGVPARPPLRQARAGLSGQAPGSTR